MQIIVISQNQGKWLREMVLAVRGSFPEVRHVYVLDRCADDSILILKNLEEDNYIENKDGEGFLAGKMRDLGLDYLLERKGSLDDTLFLDGDRIPVKLTEESCQKALGLYDMSLMRIEKDIRKFKSDFCKNPMQGQFNNFIFSCGILLKAELISAVRKLQNGRLFHPDFDGIFGDEDRYLGDVTYRLGFSCGMFPDTVYLKGEAFHALDKNYKIQVDKRLRLRRLLPNRIRTKSTKK